MAATMSWAGGAGRVGAGGAEATQPAMNATATNKAPRRAAFTGYDMINSGTGRQGSKEQWAPPVQWERQGRPAHRWQRVGRYRTGFARPARRNHRHRR